MLAPSQEENTNPNETRFVSLSDVSLAYTPMRLWPRDIPGVSLRTPERQRQNRTLASASAVGLIILS
jgi:hypothetical protein